MKRVLLVLALALGGVLITQEAQAQRIRGRVYGPSVRVYGPRVVGPRVVGPRVYGPRVYAARPYGYYAPRYSVYSYPYARTYGGWWGYRGAPYYYGAPGYYYGGPGVVVGW